MGETDKKKMEKRVSEGAVRVKPGVCLFFPSVYISCSFLLHGKPVVSISKRFQKPISKSNDNELQFLRHCDSGLLFPDFLPDSSGIFRSLISMESDN